MMNERELYPFIKCIEAGVHAIMIGHLDVPSLEKGKGLPSTLSYSIITELLKEKLDFDGLIVTDAMNMYGIANYFSAADAAVRSINAGSDILLFPPDDDIALDSIFEAVSDGTISEERINESCFKILSAKQSLKLEENKRIDFDNIPRVIGSNRIASVAQEIADKSITLIKDDQRLVPVTRFNKVSCLTITDNVETDTELFFQNHLAENFTLFRKRVLNSKSSSNDYEKALEVARQSDCVVLPVYVRIRAYQGGFNLLPEQAEFLNKLIKENINVIIISFGDPYLVTSLKSIGTYINAYGDMKISQKAVVKGLLGRIKFMGTSPVNLFL
jgi:beta-N-acetylhexosaminidase